VGEHKSRCANNKEANHGITLAPSRPPAIATANAFGDAKAAG